MVLYLPPACLKNTCANWLFVWRGLIGPEGHTEYVLDFNLNGDTHADRPAQDPRSPGPTACLWAPSIGLLCPRYAVIVCGLFHSKLAIQEHLGLMTAERIRSGDYTFPFRLGFSCAVALFSFSFVARSFFFLHLCSDRCSRLRPILSLTNCLSRGYGSARDDAFLYHVRRA